MSSSLFDVLKTDSFDLVKVHRCFLSGHRPPCFRPPCFRPHGRSQPTAACLLNWCTTESRRRCPHLRACCCAKYNTILPPFLQISYSSTSAISYLKQS